MPAPDGPTRLTTTDEAILEELHEQRLEYVALIANRCGLHCRYAEDRCRSLERRGLIEQATDEVTYRITTKGERCLAGEMDCSVSDDCSSIGENM